MTLSNRNLMSLSQFALKAKQHIGLVKAVEMFNDPHYACNILIKATLSDSAELITLSKKITNEFNFDTNLVNSIEAYIHSLTSKGADDEFIHSSKYFLVKLSHYLFGISVDGASYREAVKSLLLNLDSSEKAFCINLAREFYWFWKNAHRSIDDVNYEKSLKLNSQKQEFLKLWDKIDAHQFSDVENWPLTLYTEYMRKTGVPEIDINAKQKIAKVITVELRHSINEPEKDYRSAINHIQHLFTNQETTDYFLIVSREYFHFWVGNLPKKQID